MPTDFLRGAVGAALLFYSYFAQVPFLNTGTAVPSAR